MDSQEFANGVKGLMVMLLSAKNDERKRAEEEYQRAVELYPAKTCEVLAELIISSQDKAQRGLGAILIRQNVRNSERWQKVDAAVKAAVRKAIHTALEKEQDASVGRKLVHAIVGFPAEEMKQFEDLVPWTINFLQHCNLSMRPVALFLLGKVAEFAYSLVDKSFQPTMEALKTCLTQEGDLDCKLSASEAICSVMLSCPKKKELQLFMEEAIPIMMQSIVAGFDKNSSPDAHDLASKSLQSLQSITSKMMNAMDKSLAPTCLSLLQIADNGDLDDESRSLALQVFVEIYAKRGKTISKDTSFMQNVIQLLLRLQCEDISWEDDWQDDMVLLPEDLLMANVPGLRGLSIYALKTVAEHQASSSTFVKNVFQVIAPALRSENWKERLASVTVIGAIAGSSGSVLAQDLDSVLENIRHLFEDSDRRVVFGTIAALFEMIQSPSMKGSFSEDNFPSRSAFVLNALAYILEFPSSVPVVLCAAFQCLGEFLRTDTNTVRSIEESQQRRFLQSIVRCLSQGTLAVKEEALFSLSALALFIGESFDKFYNDLVPGIKQFIANPESAVGSTAAAESGLKADELRAAAMSCIGSIAGAVGKERFARDADEVLRLLLQSEISKLSELDGIYVFFTKVSSVLGQDFGPYLDRALPIIFAGVESSTGVTVEDVLDQENTAPGISDQDSALNPTDDGRVTVVRDMRGKGKYRVTANVFAIQARIEALGCLSAIAEAMGAAMAPFLEKCFQVVLPVISDKLNVEASINAAEAAGALLKATWESLFKTGHSMEPAQKILVAIALQLLNGLQEASSPAEDEEPREYDTRGIQREGFASAFERCMRICYTSGAEEPNDKGEWPEPLLVPPAQVLSQWVVVLRDVFALSVERRVKAADAYASEGYEEEDIEEFMEEVNEDEEAFSSDIIDSIGWIVKSTKSNFLPIFQEALFPVMSALLQSDTLLAVQNNALCTFVDVLQSCGPDSSRYLDLVFPIMLDAFRTKPDSTKQTSAFGIAQIAEHHPNYFATRAQVAADALVNLVLSRSEEQQNDDDDESEGGDHVLENAVSALGKIATMHPQSVATERILALWVHNLPLRHDAEEAAYSHRLFVELVSKRDAVLLGSQHENVLQVAKVLAELMQVRSEQELRSSDSEEPDLLDSATLNALPSIVQSFLLSLDPAEQKRCLDSLPSNLHKLLA